MMNLFISNQEPGSSMTRALVVAVSFFLCLVVLPAAGAEVGPDTTASVLPDCSSFDVLQVVTAPSHIRGRGGSNILPPGAVSVTTGSSTTTTTTIPGRIQEPCPTDRCEVSTDGKCVARPTSPRSRFTRANPLASTFPSTTTGSKATPQATIPPPTSTTQVVPAATTTQAPLTQATIPATSTTQAVLAATTPATIPPASTTQAVIPATTQAPLPNTQATMIPLTSTTQAVFAASIQAQLPNTPPTSTTQAAFPGTSQAPLPNTQATIPVTSTNQAVLPGTSQAPIISSSNTQATFPATSTSQPVIPATSQAIIPTISQPAIPSTNGGTIASTTQATNSVIESVIPCADRTPQKCEDSDGRCRKVLNTCQPINGEGRENQRCLAALSNDGNGELIYVEALGMGCAAGLVCNVANNSNANVLNVQLEGVCEPEACVGKKIPGSCNGNNPTDVNCNSATKRVTICHRTCSEKNPWVRITIDDSAWNGEGCGHQLQHDIRKECSNKAPWTAWGNHTTDYLLKEHGTRAEIAAKFNNKAQEMAYWKKWERACPSVRNGECCDWNDPDNLCCGDAPDTAYDPKIELKKYAGPVGKCSAAGIAELFDDTYTLPTSTSEWQYCYVVSVPPTSKECLYQVTLSDPALLVGSLGNALMNVTTGNTDFLCPGEVKYIEGEVEKGVEKYEAPSEAKVVGLGIFSLLSVYDLDYAGVDAPIVLESKTEVQLGKYEKDFCLYLSVDPPECPEDIVLLTKGLTELTFYPIVLSSQDEETVTFNITNPFRRNLHSVFYQFANAETGGTKCYEEADVSACPPPIEVTAHCMHGPGHPPFAIVNVWFVDQSFADVWDNDPLPKCCHADDTPAIEYTFQVYCKSQCAPDVVGSG